MKDLPHYRVREIPFFLRYFCKNGVLKRRLNPHENKEIEDWAACEQVVVLTKYKDNIHRTADESRGRRTTNMRAPQVKTVKLSH